MKDVYFIQYFSKDPWLITNGTEIPSYHFHNGFSSAYYNLVNKGDFIWLESGQDLPIESGIVYVSLMYGDNVKSLLDAAKNNPNLEIHVGGPLLSVNDIKRDLSLVNFITHPNIMVEELFGLAYDPDAWHLELPGKFSNIGYNFGAIDGTGCPWAKCTFCKCQKSTFNYRELSRLTRKVPVIDSPGMKYIWVRSATMDPDFLKLMPYREDVLYCNYFRGDEVNYRKLLNSDLHPGMLFSLGVEVPSPRMLKYVRKGSTVESLLKTIKLLRKHGCLIHINLMLGFNNMEWEDVDYIMEFFRNLSVDVKLSDITATIYHLLVIPGRVIFDDPPGPIELWVGYKTCLDLPGVYRCRMDKKQKQINDTLYRFYHESGLKINSDVYQKNCSSMKGR
jgi:hypothetical protein